MDHDPAAVGDTSRNRLSGSSLPENRACTREGIRRRLSPVARLFFACALAAMLWSCGGDPQARRDEFLQSGEQYVAKQDYKRAILQFDNAAHVMPNDAEPHYRLGLTYLKTGDFQSAVAELMKATALDPKHVAAQSELAALMATSQQKEVLEEAQQRVNQVLPLAPDNADLLDTLAQTELRLDRPQEAEEYLNKALAVFPGHLRSAQMLANMKLAKKDYTGAEQVLQQAAKQAPHAAAPHRALGQLYMLLGRPADAEAELSKVLETEPNDAPALLGVAALRLRAGKTGEAEEIYKRVSALPDQQYRAAYALYLFYTKQTDRAIQELERLHAREPENRDVRGRLIAAYLSVQRVADAEKVLDAALAQNPKDVEALLQQGATYSRTGRVEEAEKDLQQVLRIQPDSADAHYYLAGVHRARGQKLLEKQELSRALQLKPGLLGARLELAAGLLGEGVGQDALNLLNETPGIQKGNLKFIVSRNRALMAVHDLAGARKGVDQGLAIARTADLLIQDGGLRLETKDFSGARKSLMEALRQNPEDVRALEGLALSYVAQKQPARATEAIRAHVAQHPHSAILQLFFGNWLIKTRHPAQARAALNAAKAADPKATAADLLLAQLDLQEKKQDSARQRLTALLSRNPNSVPAHMLLGSLETVAGNYQAAIEHNRKVVETQPANVVALNNLAFLLVEYGNQPDQGLQYAQKAQELAPDNPAVEDTIGWAFYRKGLYATAIQHLEHAVAGEGATARRKYHLAMAYFQAGDQAKGGKALEAARQMDPNLAEAREAEQLRGRLAAAKP